MNVLAVEDLTKSFGGFLAVDGVTFSVEQGQMRGLIGANGAGKTTLLHLICGRLRPNQGTVNFRGEDVTRLPANARARLGMGLVLQMTSVFDGLTVEENLLLGAHHKTRPLPPVDLGEVGRVLQVIELERSRHRFAGSLSHGEKQWLEIGMVLLTRPGLLLLDEPTSGMTRAESRRTAELLHQLRAEKATDAVVVVEHNIEFIKLVSDRVTVMHRGSVLADGIVEEVQADPDVQKAYLGRLH
jgi:ABC-type uncharacterized transport system ATPase subunit